MEPALEHVTFPIADGHLHAVAAGPKGGKVVVLLHGFPEFWYGWRRQIPALADAGFRVVAPDQRGYNLSSKPAGIQSYTMDKLMADVVAIADQLGQERICVAGHDWGGAVGWNLGMRYAHRLERLAILNVPHSAVLMRRLRESPRQMARSWYMLFLQLPRVPEWMLSAGNFRSLARSLQKTSRKGTFPPEELEVYRRAWAEPGALTSMINWYRAVLRHRKPISEAEARVVTPTRILWGTRDRFVLPELAEESLQYCAAGELIRFPEATHWIQHEEPARVNQLLIEFFKG